MKAEETRYRLMTELQAQFANINTLSTDVNNTAETFDDTSLEKPRMFIPKTSESLSVEVEASQDTIKGIGFANTIIDTNTKPNEVKEIYNMKEFIATNPENMQTFSYDTKIIKTQMALVKRKEWQDILFSDVDWFMKIDITSGLKKIFGFK